MYNVEVYILVVLYISRLISMTEDMADECFLLTTNNTIIYTGTRYITRNGTKCQRWDVDYPHKTSVNMSSENANYCRSPDGAALWCYTVNINITWDYCDIQQCNNSQRLFQTEDSKSLGTGRLVAAALMIGLSVFIVTGLTIALIIKRSQETESDPETTFKDFERRHANKKQRPQSDIYVVGGINALSHSNIQWNPSHSFTL